MNNMRPVFFVTAFLMVCITSFAQKANDISKYNLVWDTPGTDSFGSMPLGNGDIGVNVWVEKSGDLLFYISKVDAFDSGHLLPKLGRIRIKTEPALPVEKFKQTLNLIDASILVEADDVQFRIWVDANQPLIRVEGKSKTPRISTISLESLRPLTSSRDTLPQTGTVGVNFKDQENRLAWCYRNMSSKWAVNFKSQNTPEMVAKTKDPILHRTSGCLLQAKGFVRDDSTTLKSKNKLTSFDCSITVNSNQPETLPSWLAEISQPVHSDWKAHCAYWKAFWDRSYIHILSGGKGKFNLDQCRFTQFAQGSKAYEGHKEIDAKQNIAQINQRYALERFCEAAAGRGAAPAPYNGSIFTMDMPAGVKGFRNTLEKPVSPDGRDWAILSFMWQNTRHPYWSMSVRGDYDAIRPGMQFVRDGLDINRDRCKKIFGHDGAFIMEASWWYNVGVFNWEKVPAHLRYHQLATVELPAIMCEYYEHTHDKKFLEEILIPCADEYLKFYEIHFPRRDAHGIMQMEGVGCVETYQGVTNPCTEMGGMKYVLNKLLSFDVDEVHKQRWSNLLKAMPAVPLRRIFGLDLLAVGEKYDPGRVLCESPELYSVYPFRQAWIGTPDLLAIARQSFHLRTTSIDGTIDDQATETGGWQSAPVQAAYLGLARESARLTSINFNDQFINWHDNLDPNAPWPNRPRARFPAFWETKMDGTPDNDHGANSENALQSMLLQSDGKKIFLLPAWPENWDVTFKLKAAGNTTVECEYKNGKVQKLLVTPESRLMDIMDYSTLKQRIRTLVETALSDHNYLFGLPPMLDALPIPGNTTDSWITKYGYTLEGSKAGPWINSVFNGKMVYVHVLDWPKEGVRLSAIPRTLVSSKSITGNIHVKQDEAGWLLTGTPDSINTIVELNFDRSVEDIALGLPSKGSLTTSLERKMTRDSQGKITAQVDFETEKAMDRFEFTIENPDHLRGQGKPFELQVKQVGESWKTVYKGSVYGTIFGKAIEPVTTKAVRIIVQASGIRQFDIF